MRRLLTGYAVQFNRRHRRHGHVFQNRYKSILGQEDPYLKELVRYIRLNPLRAKLVAGYKSLKIFNYTGHCALMGNAAMIGKTRDTYRRYSGERPGLVGGGLIRSLGGGRPPKSCVMSKTY